MSLIANISSSMQLSSYQIGLEIDDNGPLVRYSPPDAWQQFNNASDPLTSRYYGETFTRALNFGAEAVFSFNGTGVSIFGGRKSGYGAFGVLLDGVPYEGSASTQGNDEAAVLLFSKNDLENTNHTVKVIANGPKPFDIDKIAWITELDPQHGRAPVETTTVDDSDPAFQWMPPSAWNTQPEGLQHFRQITGHRSICILYIRREMISVYGTVGPRNAPYIVQLDDKSLLFYNATRTFNTPQTLLFFADNLGLGNHTLTLSSARGLSTGMVLEIDYAEVTQFVAKTSIVRTSAVPSPTQPLAGIPDHMNTIIIISTIFGTIVISILLWTVYRLWRRNKDEYDRVDEEIKVDNQFDWAQPSNNTSVNGTRNIAGKGRRSWFQRLSRLPRSNASRETLLPPTGGRAGAQLTSAQRQSLRQLKLAGLFRPARRDSEQLEDRTRLVQRSEVVIEEDYGHVPMEGEPAPPNYWQATRRIFSQN
ncbi:hypothetical protein BDN71DRAFT_1428426 [Pleurotus eryngii]|uniref:Uncharacterized protein n=1 Tax=Pleurotus eryngii TaxID=5323 RepID=A0A9P6A4I5_PLEER|nr:hypothetical protein BDN71DRAFT_1428426 [Pleurotus eryngii]